MTRVDYGYQFISDGICHYCKKPGHTKTDCYKLIGYPPTYFDNLKYAGKNIALIARRNWGKIGMALQISNLLVKIFG